MKRFILESFSKKELQKDIVTQRFLFMKKDKLQISTRTSGHKRMLDIRIPPEFIMIDKNGKAFVDPEFINMVHEVMATGGEYEMKITDLRTKNQSKS